MDGLQLLQEVAVGQGDNDTGDSLDHNLDLEAIARLRHDRYRYGPPSTNMPRDSAEPLCDDHGGPREEWEGEGSRAKPAKSHAPRKT